MRFKIITLFQYHQKALKELNLPLISPNNWLIDSNGT